jgi:hypothetical protein
MKKSPYEHGRQVFGPTAELNFKMGLSNFFVVQLWIWTAINYCFVGCPALLAMTQAYQPCAYTMAQIAEYFGVHYMTVSRAVRALEDK